MTKYTQLRGKSQKRLNMGLELADWNLVVEQLIFERLDS